MDDYLALSLLIMGIAIGALLVIWGAMSLYFFLRKKHRAKKNSGTYRCPRGSRKKVPRRTGKSENQR